MLGKQKYEAMSGEPEETSGSSLIVKKSITNDRRILRPISFSLRRHFMLCDMIENQAVVSVRLK
jgi:hypothetical protein